MVVTQLIFRATTEEKTLLYFMNHKPFSPKPQWKSLVPLDIKELVWIFVSIGMQKEHGCQMVIAKFLDCRRLALWAPL